ncbi:MAG: aspartate--tRNA ligase [miscellaneous Crenarchaeota group-6 archaeon AD8-1]|nr:MAG: aspartate--tRNA ligase [miscellaneous Crenarchaeota group-6 archaeon AD8-1]
MKLDSIAKLTRTHYSSEITEKLDGKKVTIIGWIQEKRDLGGILFIIMQDRAGTVQITVPKKKVSEQVLSKANGIQKRYSVSINGTVKKTKISTRGVEVIPDQIKVLGTATTKLPIDITGKTRANMESRLDARSLDLCLEENVAIFTIQHFALEAIRNFLFKKGFLEVHTPRIIGSATEGGAELFEVDYFGEKAFLAQSPQLYKEQLVMSLEKVFEVGPFFRAEDSHTRRHLSEFISVDIEQAFSNAQGVMSILEQLIKEICLKVNEKCGRELALLDHTVSIPSTPFKSLTYDEVLSDLKKEGIEINWGEDLHTEALKTLGKIYPEFYFITKWPTESKAFYIKPIPETPEKCEGFDLMWNWIELVSGGSRIANKELLIKRLKQKKLNPKSFKHHLKAFDYGMPPHAGWAIGLERLTMLLTGKKNIREVTLYPRDRMRLTP